MSPKGNPLPGHIGTKTEHVGSKWHASHMSPKGNPLPGHIGTKTEESRMGPTGNPLPGHIGTKTEHIGSKWYASHMDPKGNFRATSGKKLHANRRITKGNTKKDNTVE
jgi:hypothetical protein